MGIRVDIAELSRDDDVLEHTRWLLSVGLLFMACSPAPPAPVTPCGQGVPTTPPPVTETCLRSPAERGAVAVCNLESLGEFRVKNEASSAVQLLSRVDVEMSNENGLWHSTSALVYLDTACSSKPPHDRCVTLGSSGTIRPYPWAGFSCSGQCRPSCVGDHYMRGWPLRFVVSSCDGLRHFPGPPFRLREYEDVPL